jgi:hypothetical protein
MICYTHHHSEAVSASRCTRKADLKTGVTLAGGGFAAGETVGAM